MSERKQLVVGKRPFIFFNRTETWKDETPPVPIDEVILNEVRQVCKKNGWKDTRARFLLGNQINCVGFIGQDDTNILDIVEFSQLVPFVTIVERTIRNGWAGNISEKTSETFLLIDDDVDNPCNGSDYFDDINVGLSFISLWRFDDVAARATPSIIEKEEADASALTL